jgi:hypothetical protein
MLRPQWKWKPPPTTHRAAATSPSSKITPNHTTKIEGSSSTHMQLSPRPPCTGLFWLFNKKASALLHPESTKIHSPTPTHSLPSKLLQITPPKPQRTLPCGHQQTTRITREGGRVFNLDKDENLHGQNIRNPQPRYTPNPSQLIHSPNNNNPHLSVSFSQFNNSSK